MKFNEYAKRLAVANQFCGHSFRLQNVLSANNQVLGIVDRAYLEVVHA